MLPLEKCKELKAAGYRLLAREHCPICECMDDDPYIPPSGDELLAECVKLLDDGEWIERVLQAANGTMVGRVCIKSLLFISGHPDIHFEGKAGLTNNSDLADAWLWLNERKKRND